MKAVQHESLQLSPKVTLQKGDQFRVTGGGPMHGKTRVGANVGTYEFQHAIQKRDRWWIACVEIAAIGKHALGKGKSATIFVVGKPYRRRDFPGILHKPHRIKPVAAHARVSR